MSGELRIKVEIWVDDESGRGDFEHELPAKHAVCSRCEGHGSHLNPSIGGYAYTREEFDEAFSEPDQREEYFKRGGRYDVKCEVCNGDRVVLVVDRRALSPEQREVFKVWQRQQREVEVSRAQERAEMRAECGFEPGYSW